MEKALSNKKGNFFNFSTPSSQRAGVREEFPRDVTLQQ
jgi:hypothetical protein